MDLLQILKSTGSSSIAEFLDSTPFDEKFEIVPKDDIIKNIFHIDNKYYVPVMTGSYRVMYEYALSDMVHPEDRDKYTLIDPDKIFDNFRATECGGVLRFECRQKLVDGDYKWVQYIGLYGTDNGVPKDSVYFYVMDIQNTIDRMSGKNATNKSIEERDSLTGLLKKDGFMDKAIEIVAREKKELCCVAFDIQHFNIFNAWFGHEKGDYVLARIGNVLSVVEKRENTVSAYLGKDNFAFIIENDPRKIKEIYEAVKEIIFRYSKIAGFLPAFGVCVRKDTDTGYIEIYDRARIAVALAKKNYTDRIVYFDDSKYFKQKEDYSLLTDFQKAIENDELTFFVQPQCDLETGKIVSAEALVRWVKPDGTVIMPSRFIPFLEQTGFIPVLDKVVWEKVVMWIRGLIDRNIRPVPVSVNISQIDLLAIDVPAYLYALTERYNIPSKFLKVEITESAYAENFEKVDEVILRLKNKGFTVLMDDFGSGYSSLNILEKMDADVIKLDMEFMNKSEVTARTSSVIEAIMSMTKTMDIPMIIEGVETENQANYLRGLGCKYCQGYYFYKPMDIKSFEDILTDLSKIDFSNFQSRSTELFHTKELLNEVLFTDAMLNNILGPVAIYIVNSRGELNIVRYNKQFYDCISDINMDNRSSDIISYVHPEDKILVKKMLADARANSSRGAECTVRFTKSDGGWFWYNMHLFYLTETKNGGEFYGKVSHVSDMHRQGVNFYEILKKNSDRCMRIDLNTGIIYELGKDMPFDAPDARAMDVNTALIKTAELHIEDRLQRDRFIRFFNPERLKKSLNEGVYNEGIKVKFRLGDKVETTGFEAFYIKFLPDQEDNVYIFVNREN